LQGRPLAYGYKAATYPVESEHKKTWRIGGVHINYIDTHRGELI